MKLNDIDFDRPFTVAADGSVTFPADVWAPEVLNDDTDDVTVSGTGWTPLTGYTGQCGYRGAVMHPSEYMGGGLERHVLETPGTYVMTEVIDPEDPEALVGWAVLRLDGE